MKELNGNVYLLELLLERGVDPSYDNNNAIQHASCHGHIAVVERLLMDPRVDPSAQYNGAILNACRNGHCEIVNILLISCYNIQLTIV